jgi:predicted transcriptional regulator YdeE
MQAKKDKSLNQIVNNREYIDMEVIIVEKKSFTVIGKEGQGSASDSLNWIPPLWQAANGNFGEIRSLAKLDESGQIAGIWGAMSDIEGKFERWSDSGKYLAGCEVVDDAVAPGGWTKWVVPSYRYVAVKCTMDTYGEVFNKALNEYMPQNNYKLAGAVHEFNPPTAANGEMYIYFPIEKI